MRLRRPPGQGRRLEELSQLPPSQDHNVSEGFSVSVGDMKEVRKSLKNAIGMEMKGLTITAVRGKGPTTWGPAIGKG